MEGTKKAPGSWTGWTRFWWWTERVRLHDDYQQERRRLKRQYDLDQAQDRIGVMAMAALQNALPAINNLDPAQLTAKDVPPFLQRVGISCSDPWAAMSPPGPSA